MSAAKKGQMRVLGSAQQLSQVVGDLPIEVQGGHTTVTWENDTEQETAQELLGRLLQYRYVVFAAVKDKKGATVTKENGEVEREVVRNPNQKIGPEDDLMVIPPMAGGC